jgi:hypothetical protein
MLKPLTRIKVAGKSLESKGAKSAEEQVKSEGDVTSNVVEQQINPVLAGSLKVENLWNEAYTVLRDKDPQIIDAYETDLLSSQGLHRQGTSV